MARFALTVSMEMAPPQPGANARTHLIQYQRFTMKLAPWGRNVQKGRVFVIDLAIHFGISRAAQKITASGIRAL